jgi:hypothetical protein
MKGLFLLFFALLAVAGCGMVIHGTSQSIVCTTTPAGAVVRSVDGTTCSTPCTVILKRKKDDLLTIEREGYETATLSVRSVLSISSAANVLLPGGLICWGIDVVSGGGYRLVPNRVDVRLKPAGTVASFPDDSRVSYVLSDSFAASARSNVRESLINPLAFSSGNLQWLRVLSVEHW